jgi:hypothetical protein
MRMAKLIADLDSDEFDRRDKASTELAKLGRTAEKALRRTQAEATSPELRRRLIELMEKLGGPQGPPPPSADTVRLRIVEALEGGGTAEVRRVLARRPRSRASRHG